MPAGVQTGKNGFDGLVRGQVCRVDGKAGETAIEGVATVEAELGCGRVFEDRAGDVLQHAAVEEGGEGSVKEDGEGAGSLLEKEAVGKVFGGSSAEGQDGIGEAEGGDEGGGLEAAETGFTVIAEELGYGGAGALLEVGVEVEEVPVEARGKEAADGGFAGPHEAGQDQTFEMLRDGGGRGFVRLCEGFG